MVNHGKRALALIFAALFVASPAFAQSITTQANSVFRDYNTPGQALSGVYNPPKSDVRSLFGLIDTQIPHVANVNTWAATQTFSVAPVFSDPAGTRANLGLGALATLNSLPLPTPTVLGGVHSIGCSSAQFVNGIDTATGTPTCATPTTGSSTAAAGSSGQFQTNSSGSLAGVTVSGDVSINGTTGVATISPSAIKAQIDKLGFVSPQQVDPACGTAGHDCTAVLAALLAGAPGNEVHLGCGTYDLASPLVILGYGPRLNGSGDCSVLRGTGAATANIVQVGDGTAGHAGNAQLSNVTIWSSTTRTSACSLNLMAAPRTHLDHVHLGNFDLQAADGNKLSSGLCVDNSAVSIARSLMVVGTSFQAMSINNTVDFQLDSASWISSCGGAGIRILGLSSVNLDNQILGCGSHLIYVTGSQNYQVFLGPFLAADSSVGGDALHVDADAFIGDSQLFCTGCWLGASTAGSCVFLGPTSSGANTTYTARFSSAHISYCRSGHGIRSQLTSTSALMVEGSDINHNGVIAAGHGIWLENNGANQNNIITGNTVIGNGAAGAGWGIIQSGTAPKAVLRNNIFNANSQGDVSTPAASATWQCSGNIESVAGSC